MTRAAGRGRLGTGARSASEGCNGAWISGVVLMQESRNHFFRRQNLLHAYLIDQVVALQIYFPILEE